MFCNASTVYSTSTILALQNMRTAENRNRAHTVNSLVHTRIYVHGSCSREIKSRWGAFFFSEYSTGMIV